MGSISRYEEIPHARMIVALFSAIDRYANTFENFSIIFRNQMVVNDETSERHVEEGYGQLNIADILNQPDFILSSASYSTLGLTRELTLLPNIYAVKTRYEDCILMMLLLTPWDDLNVAELREAARELCQNFNGVYRRGTTEIEHMKISVQERRDQCQEASRLLNQALYHKVFSDHSMRGISEKFPKAGNLVAILFQEGMLSALKQCFGQCGHIYRPEYRQKKECSNCDGELGWGPPVFQPERIAIAYPKEFLRLEAQNIRSYLPIDLLFLYQASDLPSQVRLMLNRIERRIFQSSVSFFKETIFNTVEGQDVLYLYNVPKQKGDRFLMVTAICDSRFQGTSTLPTVTIRALIKTLSEEKITEYSTQKISMYPTIETWKFSEWIGVGTESAQWDQLLSWKNLNRHQHD
ncbi:MAG: hypothetical protein ACE5R6_13755 [Candidatus Heimdallarchaeota archaeon]